MVSFVVRFGSFSFTESVIMFKHVRSNGMKVLFDASCIALARKGNLVLVTENIELRKIEKKLS